MLALTNLTLAGLVLFILRELLRIGAYNVIHENPFLELNSALLVSWACNTSINDNFGKNHL